MSKLGQLFYKTLVTNISQSDIGPIHVYVFEQGNQLDILCNKCALLCRRCVPNPKVSKSYQTVANLSHNAITNRTLLLIKDKKGKVLQNCSTNG